MSGCYREVGSSRIEPMDRSLFTKGDVNSVQSRFLTFSSIVWAND